MNGLRVPFNPISDEGVQAVFNSLKTNNTLRVLDATSCGITDTGVASLAEALSINTTLEMLSIQVNHAITDNGLTCLVEVLSRSSRLVKLWISDHLKVDEVRKTINEARKKMGLKPIEVTCSKYTYIVSACTHLHIIVISDTGRIISIPSTPSSPYSNVYRVTNVTK